MVCPLCSSDNVIFYWTDKKRQYHECQFCRLVFVPSEYHLSPIEEKLEYDKHQNNVYDKHYRKFLSRLYTPLESSLSLGDCGLDFGCGPGPALAEMFKEAGYDMQLYDIYYYDDPTVLNKSYQFITITEVVEHLSRPLITLMLLWELLEAGGRLGVMTKLVRDQASFKTWHYKNDLTHISFFSIETLQYISKVLNAELHQFSDDTFCFIKAG